MHKKLTQFIVKKQIASSLIFICLALDLALNLIGIHNYHDFINKPEYEYLNKMVQVKSSEFHECAEITSQDIKYFDSTLCESDAEIELSERVEFLNKIDVDDIYYLTILVFIYNSITYIIPLLMDLLLTMIHVCCKKQYKDTQKTSFLRNIILINWVQMESLVMLVSTINSISFEECLEPQDTSMLFKDDFLIIAAIFIVCAIIQLYVLLFFLITQRNQFSCQFLTFILINFMVFHTIVIYHTAIGSKKSFNVVFTLKQWVTTFLILKLQNEFIQIQIKSTAKRINKKQLELHLYQGLN